MFFSIGICTYNRLSILSETLNSIAKWLPTEKFELIIADNNSSDGTSDYIELFCKQHPYIDIKYIAVETQGLSYARNEILNNSKYENIIFLDDDAVLASDIISAYKKAISCNPNCYIFGGRVMPNEKVKPPIWFSSEFYMLYSILDHGSKTKMFPNKSGPIGANFMVMASKISGVRFRTDLGRVGNSLASGEETDFLSRIGFDKNNAIYVGEAVVHHCFPNERYTTEWAYSRFKQNGISNRKLRKTKFGLIYGLLSEIYQVMRSISSFNKIYIKARLYSLMFYIKGG